MVHALSKDQRVEYLAYGFVRRMESSQTIISRDLKNLCMIYSKDTEIKSPTDIYIDLYHIITKTELNEPRIMMLSNHAVGQTKIIHQAMEEYHWCNHKFPPEDQTYLKVVLNNTSYCTEIFDTQAKAIREDVSKEHCVNDFKHDVYYDGNGYPLPDVFIETDYCDDTSFKYINPYEEMQYRGTYNEFQKLLCQYTSNTTNQQVDQIRPYILKKYEVFIITYSVYDRNSFHSVQELFKLVNKVKLRDQCLGWILDTDAYPAVILVGNIDKSNKYRLVSEEEGIAIAKEFGVRFMEVSSETESFNNASRLFNAAIGLSTKLKTMLNEKIDIKLKQMHILP